MKESTTKEKGKTARDPVCGMTVDKEKDLKDLHKRSLRVQRRHRLIEVTQN